MTNSKEVKTMKLIIAVRKYLCAGENVADVRRQWSELNDKDKLDLKGWFKDEGIEVDD